MRGTVTSEDAVRASVVLRVRALPTEELLFFTNIRRAGLRLPSSGTFTIEFALQLHLGAGFYRVQTAVSDADRKVDWARGPSAMVSVEASPLFGGRVDLQPGIRIVDSP